MDNENVKQKLILAKNFFKRAQQLSGNGDSLSRMISIHHFHISIEITLRNMVYRYEIPNYNNNCGFADLIGLIKNSSVFKDSGLKIPHEDKIKTINTRRNDIQHNFIEPSLDAANQTGLDTHQFLSDAFLSLFYISYDEVNELMLIESDLLRRYVEVAEKHFQRSNYSDAYLCVAAAFKIAQKYIDERNRYDTYFDSNQVYQNLSMLDHIPEDLVDLLESFGNQINRNTRELRFATSGVNMNEYERYKTFEPIVFFTMDGRVHCNGSHHGPPDLTATRAAIDFLTKSILEWQSYGGDQIFAGYEEGSNAFLDSEEEKLDPSYA